MTKRMIVFSFYMILACTLFVRDAVQVTPLISYGAIGRGRIPGCSQHHRELCGEGPPANNWTRGCNHGDRCRDDGQNALRSICSILLK
ncbi:hypothetical protein LWI29_017993 [Acer saccharum]|uniref:Uncharacterized protein n=1 Tax=Acer saccharum TaxID=4024 RepID=A0AA39SBB2_ACESA|nr:hypothetical protein LWI29_017993 [Acer saccharum]